MISDWKKRKPGDHFITVEIQISIFKSQGVSNLNFQQWNHRWEKWKFGGKLLKKKISLLFLTFDFEILHSIKKKWKYRYFTCFTYLMGKGDFSLHLPLWVFNLGLRRIWVTSFISKWPKFRKVLNLLLIVCKNLILIIPMG